MPDEAATGLEEPVLETRQGPALDGDRQDQPTQQIPEVVGDHSEQQAALVGPEAGQESRVQWVAALPSLIHCSAVPRWL